jgi:hypothetical protein
MPSGVSAAASITDALRDQRVEGVVESLFRNNEIIGEFQPRSFTGGATINITHHYAGNTSVSTFDEGDAVGQAGSQSYLTAAWPAQYYKGVISITGHAKDQLRNGDPQAAFYDQIGMEMERIIPDMIHKISTDMLGTGLTAPVGIQGICDSAGTIAGLSRTTYTWFQAFEGSSLTSSTAVTVNDLDYAMASGADDPYEGNVSEVWTSWLQMRKYKAAIGNAGVANAPIQMPVPMGPGTGGPNAGDVRNGGWLGTTPIKPKRGLTNTIWLGLTKSTFFVGDMRSWQVDPLAKNDDSDRFLVTRAVGLGCSDPRKNWKMTGYSQT